MNRRKMNRLKRVSAEAIRPRGHELLVESQYIDHPPARARTRAGYGAECEYDYRSPHQKIARVGLEFARQPPHQENDDGHGRAKYDFLRGGYLPQSDAERNHRLAARRQGRAVALAADRGLTRN